MALKLVVDKLEDVPEAFRTEYVEKDGEFRLNAEGIPDVDKLQKGIATEREAAANARKQAKQWESLGKSPEEIQELLALQATEQEEKAKQAGEWNKLRVELNEKHAKQLAKEQQEKVALRSRLEQELVDAKAVSDIAAANGNTKLLLPLVKQQVKVDENLKVVVVDAQGDPRTNASGDPMTIADLLMEMKATDDYAQAFRSSGQSGSGMRPTSGSGTPASGPKSKRDFENEVMRARWIDAHGGRNGGMAAYNALPD